MTPQEQPQPDPIPQPEAIDIGLAIHKLRFTARAESTIRFDEYKGSALRGALVGALRSHHCPAWQGSAHDAEHRRLCPVCRLLAWEHSDAESGDVRRPYTLTPPTDTHATYAPAEQFSFGLTLFGAAQPLMSYLVLAVAAMGRHGVGRPAPSEGRGRFRIETIHAVNPLTHDEIELFRDGDRTVRQTTLAVTQEHVAASAAQLLSQLECNNGRLTVRFWTPMRLTQGQRLAKSPDFFPLAKAIVLRVLDICVQQGSQRPDVVLRRDIYPHANQVQLVEDGSQWWDVGGHSARLGRVQPLGGLVGYAVYRAENWQALLPWLIWGQLMQAGKNTVKGCGVYSLHI